VPEELNTVQSIAEQVGVALAAADLSAFGDLLDPNVRWGPPDAASPPCQNRNQVLAWYERGRQSGRRARVTQVEVIGNRILVGMWVTENQAGQVIGGAERWQVLTVANGRIVDIVGFDERGLAAARAEAAT